MLSGGGIDTTEWEMRGPSQGAVSSGSMVGPEEVLMVSQVKDQLKSFIKENCNFPSKSLDQGA